MQYSIHDAIRVSGLTRGQIDQARSRWSIAFDAGATTGHAAEYSATDILRMSLWQRLATLGMRWHFIRLIDKALPRREIADLVQARLLSVDGDTQAISLVVWVSHDQTSFALGGKIQCTPLDRLQEFFISNKIRGATVINLTGLASDVVEALKEGRS